MVNCATLTSGQGSPRAARFRTANGVTKDAAKRPNGGVTQASDSLV